MVPRERWPDDEYGKTYMDAHWEEPWGDRRQELVFIGAGYDWDALKAMLDDCLVPEDQTSGPDDVPDYPDPFPGVATDHTSRMNVVSQIRQPVVPGVEIVNDPADLDHFKQPTTAATIWQKQTPPEVQTWLDGLNPQRLPHGRVILRAHAVGETVQHLCDISRHAKGKRARLA